MAPGILKFLANLSNPLALIGFVLLLFFGLLKALISSDKIKPITAKDSKYILQRVLKYGFIIALMTLLLGIGLMFYRQYKSNATDQKLDSISTNIGNSEIRAVFSSKNYYNARSMITTLSKNFDTYQHFYWSQLFDRVLSPMERVNYGAVLLAVSDKDMNLNKYDYLIFNISKLPEENIRDFLPQISVALKESFGVDSINKCIERHMAGTNDKNDKLLLKSLENSIATTTTSRAELFSNFESHLRSSDNDLTVYQTKDLTINDSFYVFGVDLLFKTDGTKSDNETNYDFENELSYLGALVDNLGACFANKGYIIALFRFPNKQPYKTLIINVNTFSQRRFLTEEPTRLFPEIPNPCDALNKLCLVRAGGLVPTDVFKEKRGSNRDSIDYLKIFSSIKQQDFQTAVSLLSAFLKSHVIIDYSPIYLALEDITNNSKHSPDSIINVIDSALFKKSERVEKDVWKGRLYKLKGLVYLHDKYSITKDRQDLNKAAEALKAAIALNPDMSEAYLHLSVIAAIENSDDDALFYMQKAIATSSEVIMTNELKYMFNMMKSNRGKLENLFSDFYSHKSSL